MRNIVRVFGWLSIAAVLALTLPVSVNAENTAVQIQSPTITLENWKNSSEQERYSFLAGFVSMLELERLWQGKDPLPISRSTCESWTRGLKNVPIRDMDKALNNYIAADNPGAMQMTVVEALGRIYVRPKLTQSERAVAAKRAQAVAAVME